MLYNLKDITKLEVKSGKIHGDWNHGFSRINAVTQLLTHLFHYKGVYLVYHVELLQSTYEHCR